MTVKVAISAALTGNVLAARAAQGARVAPKVLAAAPSLPQPALRRLALNAGDDVRQATRAQQMAAHPVPTARRRAAETVSRLEETHPERMFELNGGGKPRFGRSHEMPLHSQEKADMLFGSGSALHDPSALMTPAVPALSPPPPLHVGASDTPRSGVRPAAGLDDMTQPAAVRPAAPAAPDITRVSDRPLQRQKVSSEIVSEPLPTPATGGATGRLRAIPSNPLDQANGAFLEHDRHMGLEPDESSKIAAAYRLQGRITFRGLPISIETKKGGYRHWTDAATGEAGKTKMRYPYGYIRRTKGLDGDHVDVFVGPDEKAPSVYVIMTNKAPDFKEPDEEKCMLGFKSMTAAKEAFLAHYNKDSFFRNIKELPFEEFEKRVFQTFDGSRRKVASHALEGFDDAVGVSEKSRGLAPPAINRHIIGEAKDRQGRISESFGYHDVSPHSTAIEGAWGAPKSP